MSGRPSQAKWDHGARLLRGAAERAATAVTDLFLPAALRLSDRERLTARALLDRLLRAIEDELRAGIADRFRADDAVHAALASAHVEIAGPALAGTDLLADPDLVALLLRRAEEHRLFLARHHGGERLQSLISDSDAGVAADAMSVLLARGRRLDRFQEPILARTELPAELQHRLVWTVAAALRTYLTGAHGVEAALADSALGEAAAGLISGYDESDALEARCARLAQRLHALGRLDGDAIAGFLAEGLLPLFVAGLSAATALPYSAAWDILVDPAGRGPVLLLRAAGLDRQQAGQSLLTLARHSQEDRLVEQVALFDILSPDEGRQALALWLLDPAYRAALLGLAQARLAA